MKMINYIKFKLFHRNIRQNFCTLVQSFNFEGNRNFSYDRIQIWDETIQPKGDLVKLRTKHENIITWYSCGPTVYDTAHIGHASSYIRLDIIRRILESQNITVLQVMGVTDIDDKIIARSNLRGIPWNQLTEACELDFFQHLQSLNVKMPFIRARVSQFIPNIINFISNLIDMGYGYFTPNGSVYFDTQKYEDYELFRNAHLPESESLEADQTESSWKKGKRDFALWKGVKPGEPFWEAPWGKGRPGWHIECSVFATHFFGSSVDIHSGGMDLTFPHHNNESAQCCAKFGTKKWVSHWIHTGHLHLKGDVKMSKSIGNTVSIPEFLNSKSPNVLRMVCLMKKYGNDIEYSPETESHAIALLQRIHSFLSDSYSFIHGSSKFHLKKTVSEKELWEHLNATKIEVETRCLSNFDTPSAILSIMEFITFFNASLQVELVPVEKQNPLDLTLVISSVRMVEDFLVLVGFIQENQISSTDSLSSLFEPVLSHCIDFRKTVRNFAFALNESDKLERKLKMKERQELMNASDELRGKLGAFGIEIKDHGLESSWSFASNLLRNSRKSN